MVKHQASHCDDGVHILTNCAFPHLHVSRRFCKYLFVWLCLSGVRVHVCVCKAHCTESTIAARSLIQAKCEHCDSKATQEHTLWDCQPCPHWGAASGQAQREATLRSPAHEDQLWAIQQSEDAATALALMTNV